MKQKSIKSLCQYLWELEKDLNLLDLKIDGVNVWLLLRMKIFEEISIKSGIYDKFHPANTKPSLWSIFYSLLTDSIYFLFLNPQSFLKKSKIKYLIFPTSRLYKNNCIYLKDIILENEDQSYIVEKSLKRKYKNSVNFNFLINLNRIKYKLKLKLNRLKSNPELDVFSTIEKDILIHWNVSINLYNRARAELYYAKASEKIFYNILTKLNIDKIFIVCFYSPLNMALISAAKKANTKIIELQHGVITKYHLGYSYPECKPIPYAPDELWLFGEYWLDTVQLPTNMDTKIYGFNYFKQYKLKVGKKIKNQILFTSEGPIGKKLFKIAIKVAKLAPEQTVLFKLHPSELISDYQKILNSEPSRTSNFSIVGTEQNTYDLMLSSEYQAGVSSTTLFEGLCLGNKIILVNLPGTEYMDALIEKYSIVRVNTAEQFVEKLMLATVVNNENYIFMTKS